jgi:DNA modification methylase
MEVNIIHNINCLEGLKTLPDNSVDCCVTSPPYYGLRDYGVSGQIGLEETPEAYISKLVEVFVEVYRVLKPIGTLWINIGDSYWGGKGYSGSSAGNYQYERRKEGKSITPECSNFGGKGTIRPTDRKHEYIKAKDLIGIPWMLAFELRRAGFYLRQDIIWHKPNPMPESVKDRCTKSHEYIFLLTKSNKYFFDYKAIQQKSLWADKDSRFINGATQIKKGQSKEGQQYQCNKQGVYSPDKMSNKRDVWSVCTKAEKESHFAVFPETLIVDCIKAGCPEDGIVLDPFMGSGTSAVVARKLNRNYIGFELNPKYIKISNRKIYNQLGMFK